MWQFSIYAQIAQLVEQRTENPRVAGSIPALGTARRLSPTTHRCGIFLYMQCCSNRKLSTIKLFVPISKQPFQKQILADFSSFCEHSESRNHLSEPTASYDFCSQISGAAKQENQLICVGKLFLYGTYILCLKYCCTYIDSQRKDVPK